LSGKPAAGAGVETFVLAAAAPAANTRSKSRRPISILRRCFTLLPRLHEF
jgi:hypothetical protein